MKIISFREWIKIKLYKFRKYAYVVLAIAIVLILLQALFYPNAIDILVALILFILLIALVEEEF